MHLMEMINLRPVPAGAVFLSLTRRCPLTCAHCCTNSLMTSEEYDADLFLRFVDSFTPTCRPEMLILTGGEALLRPWLVNQLIDRAHAVGTKVDLISGMFFARGKRIAPPIWQAITRVDHFTASLDIFHEEQVPREAVFRVLEQLVERGQDVSLQLVGLSDDDPYLEEATTAVRQYFGDRVPALVALVGAQGRAKAWLKPGEPAVDLSPSPCMMAAWPVVTYDGTVIACCNQTVVDGPAPPHLRLGHVREDSWATIRERSLESPMVRALRIYGPEALVDRYGSGKIGCDGYCSTCYRLSEDPAIEQQVIQVMRRPTMRLIERQVQEMQDPATRLLTPAFAHMATLGANRAARVEEAICAD